MYSQMANEWSLSLARSDAHQIDGFAALRFNCQPELVMPRKQRVIEKIEEENETIRVEKRRKKNKEPSLYPHVNYDIL